MVDITQLSGWGHTTLASCVLWQPDNAVKLARALSDSPHNSLIGRGCGRSYGDVSTNNNGIVIDMTSLNTIEEFDTDSGYIICHTGVTMHDLVEKYLSQGFVPPVCPGTGFVTIGGAIAFDVHGKNNEMFGSFGDHIDWIELMLPSGEIRQTSEKNYPELFLATIGGAGLTGLIIRARFRMHYIGTNAVNLFEQRIDNIDQFIEALQIAGTESTYSVGWIDALSKGSHLGRGILMTAEPAETFIPVRKRRSVPVPFNLPSATINRLSVKIFNAFYLNRIGGQRRSIVDFARFVFPLDALLHWNRLYGSRGVFQFQCVISNDSAHAAIRELLTLSAQSGAASPLAVLKTFGREGRGYLSFPRPGFTLALDFPCKSGSIDMIRKMNDITLHHGGRIYLAKDACLQPEYLQKMYPNIGLFNKVLMDIDPGEIMQSDMSRRLAIRTSPARSSE